ncbi:MAG: 4Fe-4S binding protein [Candidatus Hydrogenedentes bacterium]|nr:4Fe-4S binding protein [Candidatus Hydrogenedentota bacterium]
MGMIDTIAVETSERQIAGKTVAVSTVLRGRPPSYLRVAFSTVIGLLRGMKMTLGYFLSPEEIVTQQYPENRDTLRFPERYRGNLRFKFPNAEEHESHAALVTQVSQEAEVDAQHAAAWMHEDNGARWYHNCTGCGKCEAACPNASIKVITRHGEILDDRELDRFVWRLDSCMFCNACVQACPWDAIEMTAGFENAVYDRRLLVYNLNKMAGPRINLIQDEENPDVRKRMVERRDRYGGPVPLNGFGLPNLLPVPAPLPVDEAVDAMPGQEGSA